MSEQKLIEEFNNKVELLLRLTRHSGQQTIPIKLDADNTGKVKLMGLIDSDNLVNLELDFRFNDPPQEFCKIEQIESEETKFVCGTRVPRYKCSNCNAVIYIHYPYYCPKCGKKSDKSEL